MASTKSPKSPWLKKVLIPFWILQLFFMLLEIIVTGMLTPPSGLGTDAAEGVSILYMFFDAVCIVIDITEIILFAKRKLAPVTYLVLQVVKTGIWIIVFVIYMVRLVSLAEGGRGSTVSGFLSGDLEAIVVLLTFVATLIYASVIYHRHRRGRLNAQRLASTVEEASPSTEYAKPAPQYSRFNHELADDQLVELSERTGEDKKLGSPSRDVEMQGEDGAYELDATKLDRFGRLVREESGRTGRSVGSKRSRAELGG